MDNAKLTPVSQLGEFGLIDLLTKDISVKNPTTVMGIGDDAAVIKATGKKRYLISTDLLLEGVHFDITYTPLKHLGYKAAVVNFSDMAAMNALPKQIVMGIGLSSKYTVEALEELYAGIKKACDVYGVDFVGGDTTSSAFGMHISVTVIGEATEDKIVYRSGAKPNDLVCVTGDLGGAYMGLMLLEREKKVFKANPDMQPELEGNDYVLGRQLKPEARTDMVRAFEKAKLLPTSMIDISDGLASEALHIAKSSGVALTIVEEKIPIAQNTFDLAKEFQLIPSVTALNGGEDYELLFTVDQKDYEKVKQMDDVTIVGYVTDASEGNRLITPDNHSIELKAQGWDALKREAQ